MRTKSHSKKELNVVAATWQPISPPRRGEDRTAFHAFMLLPGLSISFYGAALGRSRSSVASYRAAATKAAKSNPTITVSVESYLCALAAEDGLRMAQVRGSAQLPHWSRMAICEYRKRGFSRREIATAFRCSPGTVANVLQGRGTSYAPLSGERRLTKAQQHPPGQWADCLRK